MLNAAKDQTFFFGHSPAGELARSVDWLKTPLGPVEQWDTDLKVILALMFQNRFPQALFWKNGRTLFYNDAYIPILGKSKHPSAMGKDYQVVWAEVWDLMGPSYEDVFESGKTSFEEDLMVPVIGDNGVLRDAYFTFSYSPALCADGSIGGMLITCLETTRQKTSERKLKTIADDVTNILESMSDAFFSVDKHWIINRVNEHHLRASHFTRETQIGKNLLELFFSSAEAKQSRYWINYHKAMEERVPVHFEEYYAPFDLWTLVRAYPLADGGLAVFFTDTTEQKKANQKLIDALHARDEFLSIASHELKTPLTSMKLKAQLHKRIIMKKDPRAYEPAIVDELVTHTEEHVNRLNRLVDDMFDVSRIRTGMLTIKREPFNFCHMVQEILLRFKGQFELNGYSVPELVHSGNFDGHWDKLRMEQVVTNLLTNAVRYGKKNPLTICLENVGDHIRLTVADEGIGIPEKTREVIFDRFERAVDANEVSGLGLGLFITKQIVIAHNGKIWVEGREKEGSRFIVDLPR